MQHSGEVDDQIVRNER